MFSHIMLGANDLEASRKFYDEVLGILGHRSGILSQDRYFYRSPTGVFALTKPLDGGAATGANGGTVGFTAKSTDEVDHFYSAGISNDGSDCEGTPGYRDGVAGKVYITWLRDPAGNKICAMHRIPK